MTKQTSGRFLACDIDVLLPLPLDYPGWCLVPTSWRASLQSTLTLVNELGPVSLSQGLFLARRCHRSRSTLTIPDRRTTPLSCLFLVLLGPRNSSCTTFFVVPPPYIFATQHGYHFFMIPQRNSTRSSSWSADKSTFKCCNSTMACMATAFRFMATVLYVAAPPWFGVGAATGA